MDEIFCISLTLLLLLLCSNGDDHPFSVQPVETSMISAGYGYSFILQSDGTLWACGDKAYGQLGDGSTTYYSRTTPVQVMIGED